MKFSNFLRVLFSSMAKYWACERGTLDLTSMAPALKTLYPRRRVEDLVYKDNPFLALVPKMEEFYGENMKCPLIYGDPQSRSATFSNALTQSSSSAAALKAFLLTRNKDYAIVNIDNETLEASKSDAGAFLRAAQLQTDGGMRAISRSLAISLYRNGSGAIGNLGSSPLGAAVITLTNADDVTNFEVGMTLVLSTAAGGGSVKAGTLSVIAVNRVSGTVTLSGNISAGVATAAANDYIFQQGDYDLKVKGLQAWIPYGGPSATAFFGVDRTADSTRLGGLWQDGTAKPIEEALIDMAVLIGREGGRPDHCFMSFTDFGNLEKALGSKVQYVNVHSPSMPEIGFKGMVIQGPKGPMNVIPDQNCPSGYAYMLQLDTWELCSLGAAPKLFDGDGLSSLRISDSDGIQFRIYYYAQLGCHAPGYNGVVKLRNV